MGERAGRSRAGASERGIKSYKDLIAWRKSMELVKSVYRLTSRYPGDERFGLVAQTRRAAVSMPPNVAEGYGRRTRADYVRFLDIARGSADELETQILAAMSLGFAPGADWQNALDGVNEVQRILRGLVDSVENSRQGSAPRSRSTKEGPRSTA
jgi:four helix bundle protein